MGIVYGPATRHLRVVVQERVSEIGDLPEGMVLVGALVLALVALVLLALVL